MPFKNGKWIEPTDKDLEELKQFIENPIKEQPIIEIPGEIQELIESRFNFQQQDKRKLYQMIESFANDSSRVDIILPVYGSLHVVIPCIESVIKHTNWPYKLIIMDDCTPDNRVYEELVLKYIRNPKIEIHLNKENRGFAANVNAGIKKSTGKYICVLNSDVLVTPHWLTKLVMALESDPKHMIVNPATNNTALINIPMVAGRSYLDMNRALERCSNQAYPEVMPTGFCYMFKRKLLDYVGTFDEGFTSYGEDTDHWFRAITHTENGEYMGFKAVMADDCYIFHERSSSFSQLGGEAHMSLRQKGSTRFHSLHPSFSAWRKTYNTDSNLKSLKEIPLTAFNHKYKYNIAWVVKNTSFCGAMSYITDIVNQLIEQNVNAKVICIHEGADKPEVMNELHTAPIFFSSIEDMLHNFKNVVFDQGYMVASTQEIFNVIELLQDYNLKLVNHIQSYDLDLTLDPAQRSAIANSLTDLHPSITNAKWISESIKIQFKHDYPYVVPGVNPLLFHPRKLKSDSRVNIMINLNPLYHFKGYQRGVEFCKALIKLSKHCKYEIRILATGVLSVPECREVIGLGQVGQSHLANLLGSEVHIFVDPSHYHSYGLPALEAYISGARTYVWENKGVEEYKNEEITVFKANTPPELAAKIVLDGLEFNYSPKMQENVIESHNRKDSIKKFISTLQDVIGDIQDNPRDIVIVTPHLRKFGGPTTIINLANILKQYGHKVIVKCIYDDYDPGILRFSQAPVYFDYQNIPECDIIIVNSDNPFSDIFINSKAKKKVLLKLSHNERFKELEQNNLNLPWDHIITSSEWLRQACFTNIEGWKHNIWPEEKVTRVGWYHYEHKRFDQKPDHRVYMPEGRIRIGTLIHAHPLKGSKDSVAVLTALKKKYGDKIIAVGVGECTAKLPDWMQYMYKCSRDELAQIMSQMDIWLSCSYTEGLGRMALEAMSAGVGIVASTTGAEFLKSGANCILFETGNKQMAAEAVDKLIQDPNLFGDIVNYGYKTAKAAADPGPYMINLANLIRRL